MKRASLPSRNFFWALISSETESLPSRTLFPMPVSVNNSVFQSAVSKPCNIFSLMHGLTSLLRVTHSDRRPGNSGTKRATRTRQPRAHHSLLPKPGFVAAKLPLRCSAGLDTRGSTSLRSVSDARSCHERCCQHLPTNCSALELASLLLVTLFKMASIFAMTP